MRGTTSKPYEQRFGERPLMRFHKPDDDVRPPLQAALSLVEHVVGLAYASGRPQVNAKVPGGLDYRRGVVIFGQ